MGTVLPHLQSVQNASPSTLEFGREANIFSTLEFQVGYDVKDSEPVVRSLPHSGLDVDWRPIASSFEASDTRGSRGHRNLRILQTA